MPSKSLILQSFNTCKFFLLSYTTVSKIDLVSLLCSVSVGIILDTSVCDLCHLVSPKVVGICTFTSCEGSVFPFLQSAFASSKHTGSVCAIITLVISNLSGSKGLTKDSNSLASAQLSGAPSNTNFVKMLYMRMNEPVPSRLTCGPT